MNENIGQMNAIELGKSSIDGIMPPTAIKKEKVTSFVIRLFSKTKIE